MGGSVKPALVGVVGAGTMGEGIAQVAAQRGHPVTLIDSQPDALSRARSHLEQILKRLAVKDRLGGTPPETVLNRIRFSENLAELGECRIIIEAVIEDLAVKQSLFRQLEQLVKPTTFLATNTSSLSIASIASACLYPGRVVGVHFFNPAPLMPLVELVPGIRTEPGVVSEVRQLIEEWEKVVVLAKDTPGFIVNRVARPFYGEALRILEEGIADVAVIDHAMRTIGGFRMGPFELMDLIGNDINFTVTRTIFEAFYYDPRYKPSLIQQRMVEAGLYGRKNGRGFYDYNSETTPPPPLKRELGEWIVNRILAMLVNEAADALFWNIASRDDIELAMTRGVNYPQGLLSWGDSMGLDVVLRRLENLNAESYEDRYRPSPLLMRMVRDGKRFYK